MLIMAVAIAVIKIFQGQEVSDSIWVEKKAASAGGSETLNFGIILFWPLCRAGNGGKVPKPAWFFFSLFAGCGLCADAAYVCVAFIDGVNLEIIFYAC